MARDAAYREAERRIEKARKEGAKRLDLIGIGLTEVPDSIAALTQLQTLCLSYNRLRTLPEPIATLTWLQTLHLFNNQLTALFRSNYQ